MDFNTLLLKIYLWLLMATTIQKIFVWMETSRIFRKKLTLNSFTLEILNEQLKVWNSGMHEGRMMGVYEGNWAAL